MNTPASSQGPVNAVLLRLYMFLLPFVSALAPAEWLPLPLLVAMLVAPYAVMRLTWPRLSQTLPRDAWFMAAWLLGCLAITLGPVPAGSKNLNYSLAFLVCFTFFFYSTRVLLVQPDITWAAIGRAARLSLAFLSVAVIFEFFTASFFGVFLSDFIPYAHTDQPIADFIDERFKRPRAFAHEPGFTSLAFECLWPLTFLGRPRRVPAWMLHLLYALGFFFLGSAAGVGCLLVAALVWLLVRGRNRKQGLALAALALVTLLPLLATEAGSEAFWALFGRKLDILTLDAPEGDSGTTVLDRLNTYAVGLELISQYPLGIGWGSLGQIFAGGVHLPDIGALSGSGMLSLYLDVAVASGLPGLLAMLVFVGLRWRSCLASTQPAAGPVAVALMSVSLHHVFITEVQFPSLWLALALADRLVLWRGPHPAVEAGQGVPRATVQTFAPRVNADRLPGAPH